MLSVGILDYGLGNLLSVEGALYEIGAKPVFCSNAGDLHSIDGLIIPGVGSFNKSIKLIKDRGLFEPIKAFVACGDKPLLGICLGMQLLFEKSTEGEESKGLGFIKGEVEKLNAEQYVKQPHMGYNSINPRSYSKLLEGIKPTDDFYFVHSYGCRVMYEENMLASIDGKSDYAAVVENQNVYGVQFHPEKSHESGLRLLKNFIKIMKP